MLAAGCAAPRLDALAVPNRPARLPPRRRARARLGRFRAQAGRQAQRKRVPFKGKPLVPWKVHAKPDGKQPQRELRSKGGVKKRHQPGEAKGKRRADMERLHARLSAGARANVVRKAPLPVAPMLQPLASPPRALS